MEQTLASVSCALPSASWPSRPPEPQPVALHRCFDNWRGIGDLVAAMVRLDFDPELRGYDGRGWRAMFFISGFDDC